MNIIWPKGLSIHPLGPEDQSDLDCLFSTLRADPETVRFFHPHPLTTVQSALRCHPPSGCLDRYYLARLDRVAVGYSMLRGWDEGYEVPSFGCAIHPDFRGSGLGQCLLAHALEESSLAGACFLRLTVYRDNHRALHVYEKFGFRFHPKNDHELIGVIELPSNPKSLRESLVQRQDLILG